MAADKKDTPKSLKKTAHKSLKKTAPKPLKSKKLKAIKARSKPALAVKKAPMSKNATKPNPLSPSPKSKHSEAIADLCKEFSKLGPLVEEHDDLCQTL